MIKINKSRVFNAICLFIAVIGISLYLIRPQKEPIAIPKKSVEALAEAKIVARDVDKKGIEHVIVEETNSVLPRELFIKPATDADKKMIDSLLNDSKVQKDKIDYLLQISTTTQARNIKAVKTIDSLKRSIFTYKDKDISLSYTPDVDTTKGGLFDYRFNNNLNVIQYSERGFLGTNPKSYMDISSNNTNTTINSVNKLKIAVRPDKFSIDASAKAGYSFADKDFNVGPGIRVRLGKTTITGDYLYNTTRSKFYPWLGIERNIFGF